MKRRFGLYLLALCVLFSQTACSFFNKSTENDNAKEPAAAYDETPYVPDPGRERVAVRIGLGGFVSADDEIGRFLSDRFYITLIPVDINEWDEDELERMASSGTLPDLLRVDTSTRYFARWVEQGILRTLPASVTGRYPRVNALMADNDALQAVRTLYGGDWFVPVAENGEADSGRIYYRKDWAETLRIETPDTVEAFADMLAVFAREQPGRRADGFGLSLAGGVTYLVSLFGVDPDSWIMENGEWIPAFYSTQMLDGLRFARSLYETGLLDYEYARTKANAAIGKLADGAAGSLIRHGDAYWMNRVVTAFADANGISAAAACEQYIGVLPPLGVTQTNGSGMDAADSNTADSDVETESDLARYWPRSVETGGCVVAATVDDEKLSILLALLDYTLTDEARTQAYYGLANETYSTGADGALKLWIDPETAQPYDITQRYPAARLLLILDNDSSRLGARDDDIPSEMPPAVKEACRESAEWYDAAAIDEGDGYLIRFLHTPAKDALYEAVDFGAAFNEIVMGTEPVEDMFAVFRQICETQNIRTAIDEVNERLR